MICQSLQCLCLEIGIVATVGNRQTALQTLYLVSTNLFCTAIGQHTSGTNVIKVVQILCRIATGNLCIHRLDSLYRLALQTDIIVVSGVDNSHLRLCIVHAALQPFRQRIAFLPDTQQMTLCTFTMFIESTVVRATLTETHHLHLSNIKFYLIISN